jgi:hypothetical protein
VQFFYPRFEENEIFLFFSYSYYLTSREYESFNGGLLFRNMKGGRSENLFMSCVGELGKFSKNLLFCFYKEKIYQLWLNFLLTFLFFLFPLVLESREFDLLLGQLMPDGSRAPGLIDKFGGEPHE